MNIGIVTASAERRSTRASAGRIVDATGLNTGSGHINIGIAAGSGARIIAVEVVNT